MNKHLSEVLPSAYEGNGIFSNFVNPIWVDSIPDAADLDLYFILNYGNRLVAPVLDHFIEDGIVSSINVKKVSRIIYMRYKNAWEHLYKDYIAEYEPTHNTSFTEMTIEHKEGNGSTTNTMVSTINGSSEDNTSSTVTSTGSGSSNTNNDKYGFNTVTAVHYDKSDNSSNTNASTTSTGHNTNTNTSTNNGTDNGIYDNKEDVTVEHRKNGNIGVTETTQMLRNDVDFWKWSFIDRLCKDICDTIALSIYD